MINQFQKTLAASATQFTTTQKWTLVATILASSLVFIDSTALNVALSALQKDLGISGTQLIWVINGYALFLSSLLLVGGAMGDLYGRNKVFLIGLLVFSLSSLVCGLSQTPMQLIVSRGFQGIGGALLTPGSLSILSAQFSENNRGRAIGLWSTFSAITGVLGPVLGGWLAGMGWWRTIFFLNIPLSIIVFTVFLLRIPETKNPEAGKLDIIGAVLVTLGLAGITFGLVESAEWGFDNKYIQLALVAGVLALLAFIWVQKNKTNPMVPLHLFESSVFSGGNTMTLFVYAALGGTIFFLPLNLINIQGYSELGAGLSMLPIILSVAILSPISGKFADKNGVRLPLTIGPLVTSLGFYFFTTIGITTGPSQYWSTFFIGLLAIGIGLGTTVAPLTAAVMGAVGEKYSGVASGVNNAVARTAGVLAIAVFGVMALNLYRSSVLEATNKIGLSPNITTEIEMETYQFIGAKVPASLKESAAQQVKGIYQNSFVKAFNKVVGLAAILCAMGGVLAFVTIRNKTSKN